MTYTVLSKPVNKVGCKKIDCFSVGGKRISQYDNTIVIKNKYGNRSVIYAETSNSARRLINKTYKIGSA